MGSDEPMPSHVFDRLVSCDPELAWELCRFGPVVKFLSKITYSVYTQ